MELLLFILLMAQIRRRREAEKKVQALQENKQHAYPIAEAYFRGKKKWHETR